MHKPSKYTNLLILGYNAISGWVQDYSNSSTFPDSMVHEANMGPIW